MQELTALYLCQLIAATNPLIYDYILGPFCNAGIIWELGHIK